MTHWAELLILDHNTTERVFEAVATALEQPDGPPLRMLEAFRDYALNYIDGCHNLKEERCLFPRLEAAGLPRDGGPLGAMLEEHERSREQLPRLIETVDAFVAGERARLPELSERFKEYAELLRGHFWKETDILYPMGKRLIDEPESERIVREIEALEDELGPDIRKRYYAIADAICDTAELDDLSASLPKDLLAAMLNTLPIELSFVDAEDTVRYFSHEHGDKIFPRTRGVIGAKVQQCHPQESLPAVNAILRDFKANKRDVAEFWLDSARRKVHVRYFPVKDAAGRYLGCLEVVQDITSLQALTGERRLLEDQ